MTINLLKAKRYVCDHRNVVPASWCHDCVWRRRRGKAREEERRVFARRWFDLREKDEARPDVANSRKPIEKP